MSSFFIECLTICSLVCSSPTASEFPSKPSYEVASIFPSHIVGDIIVLKIPGEKQENYVMLYAVFNVNNAIHFIALTLDNPETKLYFLKLNSDTTVSVVGVVRDQVKIKKIIKDFT